MEDQIIISREKLEKIEKKAANNNPYLFVRFVFDRSGDIGNNGLSYELISHDNFDLVGDIDMQGIRSVVENLSEKVVEKTKEIIEYQNIKDSKEAADLESIKKRWWYKLFKNV